LIKAHTDYLDLWSASLIQHLCGIHFLSNRFEVVRFVADVLAYGNYCIRLTLLGITASEKYFRFHLWCPVVSACYCWSSAHTTPTSTFWIYYYLWPQTACSQFHTAR